ncbi:ABC transporter permease [Prolixibacteraceae bacterium Z1-6]|uniref:ABC transporter permease n=1 Tax=Draconibacterium aestuarii TaxID=2998507 RepID=A0A9X3FB28_9BACT|nr:ABC transporter permease [Prolixibacteraceae bacterium Z1-6]
MFRSYLKTTFRNLMRNKFYSAINVVGLAIGIMACVLILLYVLSELSYDKFHEREDRIYRVNLFAVLSDDNINQPVTNPPLAAAMQGEIPEVEEAVRISNFEQPVIRHNNDVFNETKWFFADPGFFKVFSASFIYGSPENALTQPNTVVLTETTANRYFGNINPVGKYLTWENDRDFLVTGVIEDYPENSHIKPDFLASFKGSALDKNMEWINNMVYTYFLLEDGYTKDDVDAKLEGLVTKYVGPAVKQAMGVSFEEMLAQGLKYRWYAQPLSEIHFDREVSSGPEPLGNRNYMFIFSIIAVFILLIACINYMNMSTARSSNRAKEVGIKKSLGSNRNSLIAQFLSESIIITFIALILALVFVKLFLPVFNNLIEKQLLLHYFDNFKTIPLLVAFGIAIGIIAGSYPAFFLASFNPVKVMKGVHKSEGSHGKLRSALVIFQLIVSIGLFSGTFVISKQLNFIQNKELGFNKENLVVINKADYLGNRISSFKNELLAQSGIVQITNTSSIPGRILTSSTFYHQTANDSRGMNYLYTDDDFLKTYQVELKEGRFFEEGNQSNVRSVVLNESAIKRLNIEDPIGKKVYEGKKTDETAFTIIGVVKDFHCESLHQEMSALVLFNGRGQNLTVRISGDIQQNMKTIENTWDKFANGQKLDYVFFDEDFGRLYKAEVQTRKIVSIFSALAILIACLGLLALAAFVAEQRTKEIGIRKVNGATISEVLYSLNKDFIKWVAIAFVIAVPGAWYLMNNWLENFAYKTTLSWWIFALAGVLALGIALLTVSWQSWRAATRNPVEALRYE